MRDAIKAAGAGAGLTLLLFSAVVAPAQTPDDTCRNGSFPANETAVGRAQVIGAGRVALLGDDDGCPAETSKCRGTTVLVPGAIVLSGHRHGAYLCAFAPTHDDAGYVAAARLKPLPVDAVPRAQDLGRRLAATGTTRSGSDRQGASTTLTADGEAYWPSAHPSARQFPGGPNVGDLSGTAMPKGAAVTFADASDPQACSATLRLIGDVLIVADNGACGGMNVSFSGAYRRR